jgi:hypothetical protein
MAYVEAEHGIGQAAAALSAALEAAEVVRARRR